MGNPVRASIPADLEDVFFKPPKLCTNTDCNMRGTSYPVRPRGNWKAKTMWLGEAAGMVEEKENITFVGPAGQLAEKTLSRIGLDLDKHFFLPNVTLCRPHPPEGSTKQNRTPTAKEVKACRPSLERIVGLHQPRLIITIGGVATKAIMKDFPGSIGRCVGGIFSPNSHNLNCFADLAVIWHPAYILRNMEKSKEWGRQLLRVRDYMIGRGLV